MEAGNTKGTDIVRELQNIISRLPLDVCCTTVVPEFGVRWTEVSQAVRNYRLPMDAGSIARVLCRCIAKSIPGEELRGILAKLKLQLVTVQTRTWHVIRLQGQSAEPPALQDVAAHVRAAVRGTKAGAAAEVQCTMSASLLYLSVQAASERSALYVAVPGSEAAALVSTLRAGALLQGVVRGLGYSSYSAANLHGHHIPSLLRVASPAWGGAPLQLARAEPYAPAPRVHAAGIKYISQEYDREFVEHILGPNPPLLTSLNIKTTKPFFDPSLLNKTINITLNLKSSSVATTLKTWVVKGAIAPDSEFIHIFHKMKANRITLAEDDDDVSD